MNTDEKFSQLLQRTLQDGNAMLIRTRFHSSLYICIKDSHVMPTENLPPDTRNVALQSAQLLYTHCRHKQLIVLHICFMRNF